MQHYEEYEGTERTEGVGEFWACSTLTSPRYSHKKVPVDP